MRHERSSRKSNCAIGATSSKASGWAGLPPTVHLQPLVSSPIDEAPGKELITLRIESLTVAANSPQRPVQACNSTQRRFSRLWPRGGTASRILEMVDGSVRPHRRGVYLVREVGFGDSRTCQDGRSVARRIERTRCKG